jgi:2',3'-cyclic-nucleotide 2'-phosphodiesterase (5'-nucleotidase family)
MRLLLLLILLGTVFQVTAISDATTITVENDIIDLTLFHVNDLHGWLNPRDGIGGMATMYSHLVDHGYSNDSSTILTSGGDQNTGPAIATVSKGEAVIEVMNAMNFDIAAIGNHEFDYGIEQIEIRRDLADFPIISANIFDVGTNDLANFTTPWVIQNHGGVKIGIIGLTTTITSTSAHPKYTQYYDFGDYETAIRDNYQDMIDAGAEIAIVLAHASPDTLIDLSNKVSDLNIPLFLGGHGGATVIAMEGDSMIAMAAHKAVQFAKIDIQFDNSSKLVTSISGQLIDNIEGTITPSQRIQSIIDEWDILLDLNSPITYTSTDIKDTDEGIGALVTDGFQYYMHQQGINSSFGIANRGGGFRDYFRAGNISVADVISVIPFENNLMLITIMGDELINIYGGSGAFSGIRYNNQQGGYETLVDWHWEIIESDMYYSGVMLDYIWYVSFQHFPGTDTGIHYRDAVINYFESLDDLSTVDRFMYLDEESTTTNISSTTTSITTSTTRSSVTSTTNDGLPTNALFISMVVFVIIRRKKKS